MQIIRTFREQIKPDNQKDDWNDISENEDREYMEECAKVDHNRPETWKAYENYPMGIIDMEYSELKNAKTAEDLKENLYHLSVACLNYWRKMKNK